MMKKISLVSAKYGVMACCAGMILLCGPIPTDLDKNNFPIKLALEDGSATTATFSGKTITASVTLPESVSFNEIAWHTGSGNYKHDDIPPAKKVLQAQVELYWTTVPLCKDTATDRMYDTVYVSTHGETVRSNKVTVFVTNVAPVIDSVWIGTSAGKSSDTVLHTISMSDTNSRISLRAGSRDVDNDIMRYDWYSTRGVRLGTTSLVRYDVPETKFTDTIYLNVYDGKGGNAGRVIVLTKLPPNNAPVIDSIRVGSRVFSQDTAFHTYSARTVDTLKFRVYAHDADAGDLLSITWTKKNAKDSLVRSTGTPSLASLVCDTMFRKAYDSLRTADTVTVLVRDSRGDSAKTVVRILQGFLNTAPSLDSIRINGIIQCRGTVVLVRDTAIATSKDTFMLRIFATEKDSADTAKISVSCKQASLLVKLSDTTARYVCKDSVYTDTISCIVKDCFGDSVKKSIVISVINRPPVLDSIRVNGAIRCTGSTLLSRDTASGRDTVMLRIFSTDPDHLDSVKLSISNKFPSLVQKLSDTAVRYVCRDSLYADTVSCVVRDLRGDSAKKSVVIAVVNRLPRIDSITVTDTIGRRTLTYKDTDSLVAGIDTIATNDSVRVRLFAHDPDPAPKDSIYAVQWTLSSGKTMKVLDTKGLIVQYPAQAASVIDTVNVRITDTRQKSGRTSLIFFIR
jgi:hypothetical protein